MTTPTTCTVRISAVTGEVCGKPAVCTFTTSRGEVFAECAEHDLRPVANKDGLALGSRIEVTHMGVTKVGTITKVTNTFVWVEVPVKPHGRPATTKVIKVAR